MWMYVRHGSRNPGDDEIPEMKTRLPALRDAIVSAHEAGVGSMTRDEIEALRPPAMSTLPHVVGAPRTLPGSGAC